MTDKSEPVAWIATDKHGHVHHLSKVDGWSVEVVAELPVEKEVTNNK